MSQKKKLLPEKTEEPVKDDMCDEHTEVDRSLREEAKKDTQQSSEVEEEEETPLLNETQRSEVSPTKKAEKDKLFGTEFQVDLKRAEAPVDKLGYAASDREELLQGAENGENGKVKTSKLLNRESTAEILPNGTQGPDVFFNRDQRTDKTPIAEREADTLLTKEPDPESPNAGEIRTYKRRWFNLIIFCLISVNTGYQWIHLSIIANVVLRYYDDSLPKDSLQKNTAVDWLSMIYFLVYLVTFLPVLWIMDFKGLRVSALITTTLLVAGTWLKVAAVNSDLFPLLLAAQTLCGLAEVSVLPTPPRLAAVWFGPDQLSTACSLGVLANQFGVAIGFLLPPAVVPGNTSLDVIDSRLRYLLIGWAVYSTLVWLLVIFGFREKPPSPPSNAVFLIENRQKSLADDNPGFCHSLLLYRNSLLRLLKNRDFLLLMISYGLNTGSFYAISTLLNNMVLYHHPGEQTSAGQIGLTIVFAGVAASLATGVWLDKTKTFKPTSIAISAFTVLGMVSFTFTLNLELWVIYLTAGALGFFMTGLLPVAYQFAAELTYPEPEGSSSGLLTTSAMGFGIVMTLGMRAMMNKISILAANIFVSCMMLVATILIVGVRARYRRQVAENSVRDQTQEITVTEKDLS